LAVARFVVRATARAAFVEEGIDPVAAAAGSAARAALVVVRAPAQSRSARGDR